jgi:LysM repeat protein
MGIVIVLLLMVAPALAQDKNPPEQGPPPSILAKPADAPAPAQSQDLPVLGPPSILAKPAGAPAPAQSKDQPAQGQPPSNVTKPAADPAPAQDKNRPAQGQPPSNLTKLADGHYTANTEPANADKFEVHVVQPGETLSGIAKTALQNHKLWPQLWETNDHIVNPHWIYPNDKILVHRLTPALTEVGPIPEPGVPPPVDAAQAPPVAGAQAPPVEVAAIPQQAVEPPEPPEPTPPPQKPIQYPTLILSAPPPPPQPKTPVFELKLPDPRPVAEVKRADLYCSGFIRHESLSDDLKVIGRFGSDPGALATTTEYVYMNIDSGDDVKPGAAFQIVRPTRNVHHLGKHFLDVGQIRVVLIQDDFALARVVYSCEALEIGDIAVPFMDVTIPDLPRPRPFSPMMTASGENPGSVVLAKNAVSNFGSVYETSNSMSGVKEGHLQTLERGLESTGGIVYIDVGRPSGVAPGDLFIVYRETPPDHRLYNLPSASSRLDHSRVAIAEIVVIKVEERASSALVTYSTDAIAAGDIIERRAPLPRR